MRSTKADRLRLYDWSCARMHSKLVERMGSDPLAISFLQICSAMSVCEELRNRQSAIFAAKKSHRPFVNTSDLFENLMAARDEMANQISKVLAKEGVRGFARSSVRRAKKSKKPTRS